MEKIRNGISIIVCGCTETRNEENCQLALATIATEQENGQAHLHCLVADTCTLLVQ